MLLFGSLVSGSSGNCVFLSDRKTNILVDCGMTGKKATEHLNHININPFDINAILVTHEHMDHISGVGIMSRKYNIPIYANEKTWQEMRYSLGNIKEQNIKIIEKDKHFEIGTIGALSFSTPHDAVDSVGYNFFVNNKKVSVLTDVGHINKELAEKVYGSDMLILEANHDVAMLEAGAYPYFLKRRILSDIGHLSNDFAAKFAVRLVQNGTKHILLGHLSNENNIPELAYNTVLARLEKNGIKLCSDVNLMVAKRYEVSSF